MAATPAQPNFFIVGAPKAGTTSLYHYLDRHPQIYMSPIKEPNHFAAEIRPENFTNQFQPHVRRDMRAVAEYLAGDMSEKRFGGIVPGWADYLRLFRNVNGETAIGEASVVYLWSPTAAANIRSKLPHAKIIMILRDPADRAFSQYVHAVSNGLVRQPFRELVGKSLRRTSPQFDSLHPFLELGLYCDQVRRYLNAFSRENINICLYEDYVTQPERTLAAMLNFLNVDSKFSPDRPEKHLELRAPRFIGLTWFLKRSGLWNVSSRLIPHRVRSLFKTAALRKSGSFAMERRDREYLRDYYKDDIRNLSGLIDRDLSAWLT